MPDLFRLFLDQLLALLGINDSHEIQGAGCVKMEITPEFIEQELKKLKKTERVVRWIVETGSDWVGDPAVWVWPVLDIDNIDSARQRGLREQVQEAVRKVTRRETGASWQPYVRFRSVSDERAEAL